MTVLNRLKDPSFRFLLWLEWIILGLSALGELLQTERGLQFARFFPDRAPIISLICIAVLAVIGLRIPDRHSTQKAAYIGFNLLLILIASIAGQVQFFFLLCIVLMLRSCLLFNRKGRWLAIVALISFFISIQLYRWHLISQRTDAIALQQFRPFLFGSILLFILVLLFLHLLMNALLSERKIRQELAHVNHQLRDYALRVEQVATLQERTRVAREIHDSIGHSLTALNLNLNAAVGLWEIDTQEAKTLINNATQLSQTALTNIRTSVSTLRSNPLSDKSLYQLVQELANELEHTTGIQADINITLDTPLDETVKITAYRVMQEAITNIIKHANASNIAITVKLQLDQLYVSIRDNGQGFERRENPSGFGLRGMQERVMALGGTLTIKSAIDAGCRIDIYLPQVK